MHAIVGLEVDRAVDVCQLREKGWEGSAWPGIDILDHHCPGGGPVRLPQLDAMHAVVGCEVERAVDDHWRVENLESDVGVAVARIDILEHHGPGGSPVGRPEFRPM